MRLDDGVVAYTPSDLRSFMTCQLDTLRQVDALLGRRPAEVPGAGAADPLGVRLGEVGLSLQDQVGADYVRRYGRWRDGREGGVAVVGTGFGSATHLLAADAVTRMGDGPDVFAQLPIAAGRLYGAADFIVRLGERWQLVEVRLGLRVKDVYLTQIGALALGLLSRGILLDAEALLVTGNLSRLPVPLVEAMARAREVMAAFDRALDERATATEMVSWDDDTVQACGWCPTCLREMTAVRDVRLTAGLRMPDRAQLRAVGVRTIDDLASALRPISDMDPNRFATLRAQARLQVRQMPPGTELDPGLQLPPVFEVYDQAPLRALPARSPGDVFFDFESDPMWSEGESTDRGLHYLFGMWVTDASPPYIAFWAHDREEERKALRDFVLFVRARLRRYPDLRIFHYGSYETMVLRELARRSEYAEAPIDDWIERGVFLDLLPVVKGSIRTSQPGYGLKKIEPLYMGSELRSGSVTDGAASVASYQQFGELRAEGRFGEAAAVLDAIADYNRYDCLSTLRLRDWLLGLLA